MSFKKAKRLVAWQMVIAALLGNKNQAEGTPLMRQWVSRAGLWSLV